jgi:hypothetical protein
LGDHSDAMLVRFTRERRVWGFETRGRGRRSEVAKEASSSSMELGCGWGKPCVLEDAVSGQRKSPTVQIGLCSGLLPWRNDADAFSGMVTAAGLHTESVIE